MHNPNTSAKARIKGSGLTLLLGYGAIAVLIGVIGAWSVQTKIAGAVIASGLIQVENNRQVLQHPEGGVVGALLVRDGDRVQAGEIVLKLDDAVLRTELAIVGTQLDEVRARSARLVAERDNAPLVAFAPDLIARAETDADLRLLLEGQTRLFEARRHSLAQEVTQLDAQASQISVEIEGVRSQFRASTTQAELVQQELADTQTLFDRGLTQNSRLVALKRERASLEGQTGQLLATIAQLEQRIAALEIEKLRLASTRREQAITSLRDLGVSETELTERLVALRDRLSKMEVRTPVSGVVYGSTVFAEQTVVRPAEPMMFVVPQDQRLVVSAKVEAIHIDQVHQGQEASLRFVAFDQRQTPEIIGVVTRLSADAFTDDVTGLTYYQAEVVPRESELDKLGDQVLLPGMPVEAFIRTADRTPLSYLVNPLTSYFNRAFRES